MTSQTTSRPAAIDALSGVRRLALALAVTRIGATAAYLAVAVQIWRLTHSAAWDTAALLLTFGVGGVLPLLTSPLADRFDRRTVMVASQLTVAVTWVALAAWPSPLGLVVLGFLSALAESPFFVAAEAAVPGLAGDEDQLSRANSWMALSGAVAWILGPLLGGVLLGSLGIASVFVFDAATSVVAAVLIARIAGPFHDSSAVDDASRTGSALAGLRVLGAVPLLRRLTLGWTVAMLGLQGANVVFAPLAEQRGAGPLAYAGWLTAWGGGLVVGSLLGRRLTERTELGGLVLALAVAGCGLAGMGLAPTSVLVSVTTAVAGVGFGLAFVADSGLVQRATPDAVRARTRAVYDGIIMVAGMVSMLVAGLLLARFGAAPFFVMGGIAVVAAAAVLALPGLRRSAATAVAPVLEMTTP